MKLHKKLLMSRVAQPQFSCWDDGSSIVNAALTAIEMVVVLVSVAGCLHHLFSSGWVQISYNTADRCAVWIAKTNLLSEQASLQVFVNYVTANQALISTKLLVVGLKTSFLIPYFVFVILWTECFIAHTLR